MKISLHPRLVQREFYWPSLKGARPAPVEVLHPL